MTRSEGISFDRYASAHGRRTYGMREPDSTDRDRMVSVFRRLAAAGEGSTLAYATAGQVSDDDLEHVAAAVWSETHAPAEPVADPDQDAQPPAQLAA